MLLVWASSTTGATLYIPSDYATIQAGIDAAQDGDQIAVAPGTYYERIAFGGKAIRLYSRDGASVTTIDGEGIDTVVKCTMRETSATILEGFTIRGGSGERGGGMLNTYLSSSSVINCTFSGNWA